MGADPPPPPADPLPPSAASIRQVLEASQAQQILDVMKTEMQATMLAGLRQSLGQSKITSEQQKVVEEMGVQLTAAINDELSWDKLEPVIVDIYAKSFSQDEIDGLLAFYSSPLG